MSVPITEVTTPEPEALAQYSAGTWKSPVKTPLSLEVSTKVNPEPPRPSPPAGVELHVAVPEPAVAVDFNHSSSSKVTSSTLALAALTELTP